MWRYVGPFGIIAGSLLNRYVQARKNTDEESAPPSEADLALWVAVGKALRALRKERGISQEALALNAGVSRGYLSELERGEHDPGLWTLWRLSKALKITLSRLAREIVVQYEARNRKMHDV